LQSEEGVGEGWGGGELEGLARTIIVDNPVITAIIAIAARNAFRFISRPLLK